MEALFSVVKDYQELAVGLSIGSVAMFVLSLLLVPWLIARAPEDYFVRQHRAERTNTGWVLVVLKNMLGVVLALMGIAMLVLPGQGMLMVVVAISLLDFPGKRRFQLALVRRPNVARPLQWLRRRAHKPPFVIP